MNTIIVEHTMYKEITKNFEIQIILVVFIANCICYKKSCLASIFIIPMVFFKHDESPKEKMGCQIALSTVRNVALNRLGWTQRYTNSI